MGCNTSFPPPLEPDHGSRSPRHKEFQPPNADSLSERRRRRRSRGPSESVSSPSTSGPQSHEQKVAERRRRDEVTNLKLVVGKWLHFHAPRVKTIIQRMLLGAPPQRAGATAASTGRALFSSILARDGTTAASGSGGGGKGEEPHLVLRVEAAGSGSVLIPRLRVAASATVPILKSVIHAHLPDRPPANQVR